MGANLIDSSLKPQHGSSSSSSAAGAIVVKGLVSRCHQRHKRSPSSELFPSTAASRLKVSTSTPWSQTRQLLGEAPQEPRRHPIGDYLFNHHQHHLNQHHHHQHQRDTMAAPTTTTTTMSSSSASASASKKSLNRVTSQVSGLDASFRYKNIWAARSVPILFIMVCFLIIANTRCDQVGGANVDTNSPGLSGNNLVPADLDKLNMSELANLSTKDLELLEQQASALKSQVQAKATKMDPLNMLREIYLDQNSKIVTMLAQDGDQVQKFHPNGRYGRRSVDNISESHVEYGKLIYRPNEWGREHPSAFASGINGLTGLRGLKAVLESAMSQRRGAGAAAANPEVGSSGGGGGGGDLVTSQLVTRSTSAPMVTVRQNGPKPTPRPLISENTQKVSLKVEMRKLLRCSYTGMPNLYWCDSKQGQAERKQAANGDQDAADEADNEIDTDAVDEALEVAKTKRLAGLNQRRAIFG